MENKTFDSDLFDKQKKSFDITQVANIINKIYTNPVQLNIKSIKNNCSCAGATSTVTHDHWHKGKITKATSPGAMRASLLNDSLCLSLFELIKTHQIFFKCHVVEKVFMSLGYVTQYREVRLGKDLLTDSVNYEGKRGAPHQWVTLEYKNEEKETKYVNVDICATQYDIFQYYNSRPLFIFDDYNATAMDLSGVEFCKYEITSEFRDNVYNNDITKMKRRIVEATIDHFAKAGQKLFLSFDFGTQSLKYIVVDSHSNYSVVHSSSIIYDDEFPQFHTQDGVKQKGNSVTVPSLLFIAALELALSRLSKKVNMKDIVMISGSAQQHGSIYWKREQFPNLSLKKSLIENLIDSFSLDEGPIWMDSSTSVECQELEQKIGGSLKLAEISGSRAYERFTVNQIARTNPQAYEKTKRISLISSALASVLLGCYSPIDHSDGSGMNLLDIRNKNWSKELLSFSPPGLFNKLKNPVENHANLGRIHRFFQEKYHFSEFCCIAPFTGDNPSLIAGLGLSEEGSCCISLGTSDTLCAISKYHVFEYGHLMINPINPSNYFTMLCYRNGSLTRDFIRGLCHCNDWKEFNSYIASSPPGNNGNIGFYFLHPEIIPRINKSNSVFRFNTSNELIDEFDDASINCRAVVEWRFLSMRLHCKKIKIPITNIVASGGSSHNNTFLQILSDVFGVPIFISEVDPSLVAAFGGALRAIHAYRCALNERFIDFHEIFPPFLLKKIINPIMENNKIYSDLLPRFEELENRVIKLVN